MITTQPSFQNSSTLAYHIIEKLWKLNRIFCSSDYDTSLNFLSKYIPLHIHEYRTSTPYKGWVIPPKWDLIKANIKFQGNIIFEADHPLKIIGLSNSFKGTVSLQELKKHLHYDQRNDQSVPYHFRQHYRPWEREWGFCVTKHFFENLKEGEYDIEIVTNESEGYLRVAEYIKQGKNPEGFAFVAHLDHPGMANDDLSGVAVGVELFHKLAQIDTKFTYRLVIVQEIIGSVFYLEQALGKRSPILESCFLEMLGTQTPLALQSSRLSKSLLEKTLEQVIHNKGLSLNKGAFRSIVCNDENVWESHQIPMCSLSRYPYPQYHSDKDNLSIISQDMLTDAVTVIYETILKLDNSILMHKHFEGVFSLAHPDYNLYIDPGQPAFIDIGSKSTTSGKLRTLMDDMPLLPTYSFVNMLADDVQLPLDLALKYLKQWESKGLISLR